MPLHEKPAPPIGPEGERALELVTPLCCQSFPGEAGRHRDCFCFIGFWRETASLELLSVLNIF